MAVRQALLCNPKTKSRRNYVDTPYEARIAENVLTFQNYILIAGSLVQC